ncbi:hypothetical protein ACHAW5_000258 [Stephanodiscus triporus]|uniref:NADP-dependent oxidoreductase domain-containing protein n=1 Tax=Stephanodiscus triporus TaxID=2934178 RepID=A0ABD3NBD0_9STRA
MMKTLQLLVASASAATPFARSAGAIAFADPSSKSSLARMTTSSYSSSSSPAARGRALASCPTVPLRDGTAHPIVGFGTYKVGFVPASASSAVDGPLRPASDCVGDALRVGYRFLECAEFYGNEAEVGKAIEASGIARDELFLCSKVWTTTIERGEDAIRAQLDKSEWEWGIAYHAPRSTRSLFSRRCRYHRDENNPRLRRAMTALADLGTNYVDLYLIHWPVPGKHVDAYKTLEKLQREGKIRNIGVSNYAVEDYKELLDGGIESKPAVNQIEINPFLYRKNTIAYFRGEGVVLQSYRSLRDGKAMDHPSLSKIGAAHSKSPAQILGRWCVQHGFVYTPKSVKVERMVENSQVFDFELSEAEMEELDGLTTAEALDAFQTLYRKCVNRDTTKDGTMEGVKMDITVD